MALEEVQFWSWTTSGWARISFLVRFLYDSKALLKINWKWEEDEVEGIAWDMGPQME